MDLDKLAESFSSDVINEAISEIIEEDLNNEVGDGWYQQPQTPPTAADSCSHISELSEDTNSAEIVCQSPKSQSHRNDDMEKVSPVVPRSGQPTSVAYSNRQLLVESLPTSQFLKDVPGYISPESRCKILDDIGTVAGEAGGTMTGDTGAVLTSQSEDTMHTLKYDDGQDTLDEDITCATRKSSFSAMDERSVKSTYSSCKSTCSNGRQLSEGASSVGSTTVFNSIASNAFDHKRHLSPLIDMSERSLELERSLAEERKKHERSTIQSETSSKSTPRGLSSHNSSRLQPSPREQHSRVSSATEYTALPQSLHDSKLSPNMSAQLVLSPDLAQRVSAILSLSSENIPKLAFNDTVSSKHDFTSSSPRAALGEQSEDTASSGRLSQDKLDKRVSEVLERSESYLGAHKEPTKFENEKIDDDCSYLDKYLSPSCLTPRSDLSRRTPHSFKKSTSRIKSTSPMYRDAKTSPSDRASSTSSYSETSGINSKYLDESSRKVLEQAAEEYYSGLKKSSVVNDSACDTHSPSRLSTTGNTHEELINLTDGNHSPIGTRQELTSYKHSSPSTSRHLPSKLPSGTVSEEETQSLVSKRLDRIEFMVLSALNEVPPQHRIHYEDASAVTFDRPEHSPLANDDNTRANNDYLADVIKPTAPQSPIEKLPNYNLRKYSPPARRDNEESFNIGISPVKRDPFKTFNRAQEVLAERLAQRTSEKTPGRRTSGSRVAYSPIRDSGRSHTESRYERAKSRDRNISPRSGRESVATTVESTHIGSDDAQPPNLPKDALGSRKDPVTKSPGIYGTRSLKASTRHSISPNTSLSHGNVVEREGEKLRPSVVGRAERALLRGNQIRERILERHQERKSISPKDEIRPLENASPTPLNQNTHHSIENIQITEVTGRQDYNTDNTDMKHPGHKPVETDRSIPLDFYSSPGNSKRMDRSDGSAYKSRAATRAWAGDQQADYGNTIDYSKLERVAELKESSLERAAKLKQRLIEGGLGILNVSHHHSPERVEPLPRGSNPSTPIDQSQRRSHSPPHSRSFSPQHTHSVRPLERVDSKTSPDFSSRLTYAVNDRLMTYHILREELMRAEDEVKGRELNLAWQRISKRKQKLPSEINESSTSATSASSEVFDENRMKKLKSLLKNPLGHLVSKSKSATNAATEKPDKYKYKKLMERIEQQRRQEDLLTETNSTTTVAASSDDSACSKCERKRNAKRAAKGDMKCANKYVRGEKEAEPDVSSVCSATRPVTPTGLPVPCIEQGKKLLEYNRNNNQSARPVPAPRPTEKRLKDVAVMCPTPSTPTNSTRATQQLAEPRRVFTASDSAVLYKKDEANKVNAERNAFQRFHEVKGQQQEGLVWFVPYNNPRPWTKSPVERKALSVASEPWIPSGKEVLTSSDKKIFSDISNAFKEVNEKPHYTPTLQEAFRAKNRKFVSSCRERQRQIKLRADERQINKVHDEQRAQLFDIQPFSLKSSSKGTARPVISSKRAIPKDEMYDRTNRMYRVLPEVTNKVKSGLLQQERMAYRVKAKLFNKKVQRHVLDQARVTNLVRKSQQAHRRA